MPIKSIQKKLHTTLLLIILIAPVALYASDQTQPENSIEQTNQIKQDNIDQKTTEDPTIFNRSGSVTSFL